MLIRDNETGKIHKYGTNRHDALRISEDGKCLYYENLQNGDGSFGGGYSIVMEDGKTPEHSETADARECMCYADIGGFKTTKREASVTKTLKETGYPVAHISHKKIAECAEKILKNTTNIFIRSILADFLNQETTNTNDSLYLVFQKICEDGYDISSFGLWEIPHPNVYCFYELSGDRCFDVYTDHFNGGNEYVTVGYVGSDSNTHDAKNIKEAIANNTMF